MAKLKLGAIDDDKPVKLTVALPAAIHRDLVAYGEVLARESGAEPVQPAKLIAQMIAQFMGMDRAFAKLRRRVPVAETRSPADSVAGVAQVVADN